MKNIVLIFAMLSCIICSSQNSEDTNSIEIIKNEAGKFLVKNGEIENLSELDKKMSIIEIINNKVLGHNEVGVYRLYPHKSPSFTYIILKNRSDYMILDLKDFAKTLEIISKFFKNSGLENKVIVNYLDKILEVYYNNDYDAKLRW